VDRGDERRSPEAGHIEVGNVHEVGLQARDLSLQEDLLRDSIGLDRAARANPADVRRPRDAVILVAGIGQDDVIGLAIDSRKGGEQAQDVPSHTSPVGHARIEEHSHANFPW
jgi:hypothetical protein